MLIIHIYIISTRLKQKMFLFFFNVGRVLNNDEKIQSPTGSRIFKLKLERLSFIRISFHKKSHFSSFKCFLLLEFDGHNKNDGSFGMQRPFYEL